MQILGYIIAYSALILSVAITCLHAIGLLHDWLQARKARNETPDEMAHGDWPAVPRLAVDRDRFGCFDAGNLTGHSSPDTSEA